MCVGLLFAIRKLVYEDKKVSMKELKLSHMLHLYLEYHIIFATKKDYGTITCT